MSSSIQVAIKVRPLIKREIEENLPIQWSVQDKYIAPLDPELKKRGEVGFSFDHIFDTDTTNVDVFNTVAKPIIEGAVTGFNGTIFAYGQTSSGKTYTMMGTNKVPGVIPLAINHIFDLINQSDREFLLRVSYIEIYNERVNDLLNLESIDLKITEDQKTGQANLNCQEEVVNCPENVLTIVKKGNKNRRIGETNMNERSSRSHTILRITIESRSASADESEAVQVSQLNLVDLAGSERMEKTGAIGTRFKEGTHINLSLSTLGLVIKQLSESQDNPKAYVNFRDSKLTRILRCSLGGNAMTTIICAVTPAAIEETQCTLAFASRAKCIKNKPKVNEELSEAALLKRYAKQIAKLETELQKANSLDVIAMESKLLEKERVNQLLADRIELLKNSILCGNNTSEREKAAEVMGKRRRTWGGTSAPVPKFSMFDLPTINELEKSPEVQTRKCTSRRTRGRSIIIKDIDIMNESFQTEFTDFELELIETQRERENDRMSTGSEIDDGFFINKRAKHTVTFRDTPSIFNDDRQSLESNAEPKSPEQCNGEPESPETPKVALRNRIRFLMEQYNLVSEDNGSLMEFTKLEKQMMLDEEVDKAMAVHNEKLAATEQMFNELNAKYTELQIHSANTDKLLAESNDRLAEFERQMTESTESLRALRREKQALVDELTKLKGKGSTVESSLTNGDENESSSIFENASYFEDMNVSDVQADTIFNGDSTNIHNSQDHTVCDGTLANITANTTVTSDVREVKLLAEQLSETVQLLTIENADLTTKLANEKERASQKEKNLEDTISELLTKIHAITEEKNLLRNNLSEFERKSEQFNVTEPISDETANLIKNYKKTIASLTAENEELSLSLMDKIEELERAKDTTNDHKCVYRELANNLGERNKLLEQENIELSNNLMEKIEEYDCVKEQLEAANNKIASSMSQQNFNKLIEIPMNTSNIMDREITANISDILFPNVGIKESNRLAMENQPSNGDVAKDRSLSINNGDKSICDTNENVVKGETPAKNSVLNGSNVGHQTIDEILENSMLCNGTLRDKLERDDSSETWRMKAEKLAEQVNELQRLNIKLKDVKLTNCKQCAHLIDLNEDRRALKNEVRQTNVKVREANMKLQELQDKFEREYAHGELLRTKVNEDLNISICDSTLNESAFLDSSFNVSVVEERVQRLRTELDALTEQHSRLTNDYNEKCNEIEKLQEAGSRETTPTPSSNESPKLKRNEAKIEKIQTDMENTKMDLRRLKKGISSVRAALHKFESERNSLKNEIEVLKAEKLELQEKSAKIADSSVARDKVDLMKEEIERLKEKIDDFDALKKELERVNASLEDQLRASEIERAMIAKKIEDIDDLSGSDDKIKELLLELARVNEEMESVKTDNQELRDAKSSLEAECDFLISQKTVVEQGSDELMRSLRTIEEENGILKTELEKLRIQDSKIFEDHSTIISKNNDSILVESLTVQVKEATELDDLKSQLTNLTESFEQTVAENTILKENLTKFRTSEDKSSELESLKVQLKEAIDKATKYAQKNSELEERFTKLSTTQAELDELKLQMDNVTESLNQIVAENAILKEKLTNFEISEDQSSVLESLELRVREASDEATRYAEKNAELEKQLTKMSTIQAEVDDLKSQLKNVTENFEKITAENVNLKEQLTNFETSENKSSALESLEMRLKEATDEVTRYIAINAQLEERVTKIVAAEAEIEDLKAQLQNVTENHDKIIAQNADLKEKLTDFKTFKDQSSVLESLEVRLKEATDEVTKYIAINAQLEERVTKIVAAEAEIEDLKAQLQNVTENHDKIIAQNADLKEKLTDFKTFKDQSSVLESLEVRLKEATDEVTRYMEMNDQLEEQLMKMSTIQNESDDLKLQLQNVTENLEKIIAENANLKEKLTNFENMSSASESLQVQLKEATEGSTRYMESNAELEERSRKIGVIETEMEGLKTQLENVPENFDKINAEKAKKDFTNFESSEKDLSSHSSTLLDNDNILDNEKKSWKINNSYIREHEKTIESLNIRVQEITIELDRYAAENAELNVKVTELQDALDKCDADSSIINELREELNAGRDSIMRELKSLKPASDCDNLNVSELFVVFMREIMAKEQELMRKLVANAEQEKRELRESKRQSDDAEKRAKIWAKELEVEIERLQQDLIGHGKKNADLTGEISRLTNLLMESNHENEMLKEKMEVLELDFNTLQSELETHTESKNNTSQEEKERLVEEALASRELELNLKLRLAAKQHKEKIDELTTSLESYKMKNLELTNNLEAIEINDKHLKNIVDTKSVELTMCNTTIEKIQNELKILTEKYDELSRKSEEKSQKIDEITALLKNKCDKLSEYKTKLETMTPEYDNLKDQAAERQVRLEMYKSEIECMTNKNETALSSLRDELNSERIKSSGYQKQLNELTNKNVTLQTELDELRTKCEDLEIANAKMAKSLRNSTSKIRAEQEIEDLRDSNKTLQSNLDGAANRIIELQEQKTQTINELAELRQAHEVLLKNNEEMKNTIKILKADTAEPSKLRERYELLAAERDALELEVAKKKSMLEEMQQRLENFASENEKLSLQNKELDEEMDDIVNKIHELDAENTRLHSKLFTAEEESRVVELATNAEIERLKLQIKAREAEFKELESHRDRLRKEVETVLANTESLTLENRKLREKISRLERTDSSSCNCVKLDNRRRRSRSELFDQNRQIDGFVDGETIPLDEGSRCTKLENKVRELELELVTKKGQLAALQVQIIREERPYKDAADELKEMYSAARSKIQTQLAEIQKLRDLNAQLSIYREKCKHWSENHADKSTQCLPEPLQIRLNGLGSGFDRDCEKNAPDTEKIKRLEKMNEALKDKCRNWIRKNARLERKISSLEKEIYKESSENGENRPKPTAPSISIK